MTVSSPVIVAIDVPILEDMHHILKCLDPKLCRIKIGHILFTHYGPRAIEVAMKYGYQVFLDLKFHDIPETVLGACHAVADFDLWMVNFHIQGGSQMLKSAISAFASKPSSARPLLIGVTILTSLAQQDLQILGMHDPLEEIVLRLARLGQESGLDGVVCSAQEATFIRKALGKNYIIVTPGIRLAENELHDQKRVMTPAAALAAGANYLVIGRPITQAKDPLIELEKIIAGIRHPE